MQGKLHQYHLIRELAKKYSHVTYLAAPTDEPECQVILTMFVSSLFSLPHEREKVLQKAQCIQELEHPHLFPILDMGIDDEQPFVVREYLPHESLRNRLRTLSPDRLSLREALLIVSQVGEALAYAHEHSIFHGNIKPENIFFDANDQAILVDFYTIGGKDAFLRDQTTEEYAFCYLAPEQFVGTCDARSDQYSLGCLAYELITGRVPFSSQSLASLMGHQNNTLPSPLSESIANIPPSLETAILKTLAKDPDERFFDFSLFLEVVRAALSPAPIFPLMRSAPSHKTSSRLARVAEAKRTVSSIRKRAATKSSQRFTGSAQMEDKRAEPVSKLPASDVSMPKRAGIILPAELSASHVDCYQLASPLVGEVYLVNKNANESGFDPHRTGIGTSQLTVEKTFAGEAPVAESQSNPDQTHLQQEAADLWLTNLFEEQERNDLPPIGSASLEHEPHKSGRDKRDKMTLSLPKDSDGDMPLKRKTQHKRSRLLLLVLFCFLIAASSTYVAFFPLRTSKPDRTVRPTQVVKEVLIPVQNSIFPTQLALPVIPNSIFPTQPAIPVATVQPTSQTSTTPAVIPFTPMPILQITTIDDSVVGTGTNQFDYVGGDWQLSDGTPYNCQGNPCEYDGSNSWDNTTNDYMTLTFTGVQIKFYGVLDPKHGIGAISVDGSSETTVDFYSDTREGDQLMWTSPMLPAGTHTFKLRVTGTKNPNSTNYFVAVDRIDILS